MSKENVWIPSVGDYICVTIRSVPSIMVVARRIKENGKRFLQCGEYLFPLDDCSPPLWLPKPGDRVRAKICRYEGKVNHLYVHEQGYVMADCRMYRQENGKPVHPDFRIWPSPLAFLEPMEGGKHG